MIIIRILIIPLATLLTYQWAMAAPQSLACKTVKNLNAISEECRDNQNYVKAATECLKSYEALVSTETNLSVTDIKKASEDTFVFYLSDEVIEEGKAGSKKVEKTLESDEKKKKNISENTGEKEKDDSLTPARIKEISDLKSKIKKVGKKKIDSLIETAKLAKTSISEYKKNITYPEDWDAPEEVIGNAADYIESHDCYSKARDSIEDKEYSLDAYTDIFTKSFVD